ncbi:MAG: peptidoglycan-binding protein [Comamonas sp.]|nr:peptidoglycan-binding protein [Comamonas sp.]
MHRTLLHTRMSWAAMAALSTVCLLPAAQANVPEASAPVVREFSAPAPLAQDLRYRMVSPMVRELQIRLRHAKYLATYDAHDRYDGKTRAAVEKFQRDNALPVTGSVNQATWDRLRQQSHEPTPAELGNTDVGPWFTGPKHPAFVMELQSRLKQAGTYSGAIDGELNSATRQAVASYRARMGLPAADVMDERTWARLMPATRNPSYRQLFNAPPQSTMTQTLDPRCASGKVVCISKAQKKLSYVVDGEIKFTREARFSRPGWDSPEGDFRVWYMNKDTVSTIFGERTPMPYAIFYDGNVAIHFSDDFADNGYASGSHGCSQIRDYQAAKWLYEQVKVGDRVVVYQ